MKKLLCLFLSLSVLIFGLTACKQEEKKETEEKIAPISYQEIVKANRRQDLARKYGCVKETYTNKNTKNGNDIVWSMSYEVDKKAECEYNVCIDMGDFYRAYYYDGNVYISNYDVMSYIINYREEYKTVLNTELLFSTRLNYKYYTTIYEKKVDGGFETKYSFKADSETAEEFSDWGIAVNDEIHVVFKLKHNKEISKYTYYHVKNGKEIEMAEVSYGISPRIVFPQQIVSKENRHTVNIYENFGSSNTYKETYEVPDGFMLSVNNNLGVYDAYVNPQKTKAWHFAEDYVTKNLNLYLDNFSKGRSYIGYEGLGDY